MLPQREGLGIGQQRAHDRSRISARDREGDRGVYLGVHREGLRVRPVNARPVARHRVLSLSGAFHGGSDAGEIAEEEVSRVHEQASALARDERERRDRARGE